MLNKILSIIAVPLSLLVAANYFEMYSLSFDITLIGAVFLIVMQVVAFISVHTDNQGTLFMGKVIKTVLAIPGILYIIGLFVNFNLGFDLEIVIALFIFTEGLYGLH